MFGKITGFLGEVRQELSKVSWSTRQELIDSTFVVIGITVIMAVFIGVADLILSKLLQFIFS